MCYATMFKKTVFFFLVCFLFLCDGKNKQNSTSTKYPQSYRDHVYRNLSENGKQMFFGLSKHPLCVEKKGQCIPRGKCIGKKMLYLSRVCYRRDLVCCYDDTIRFPVIALPSYTVTSVGAI